jgi:hypothetical protein
MDHIFFLRSYGDFMAALYAIRDSRDKQEMHLIASDHLRELFEALPLVIPGHIRLTFADFGIRHGIMSCFTNKFLVSAATVKELGLFKKYLTQPAFTASKLYVEQYRRISLLHFFSERRLVPIHQQGNIYHSYTAFFNTIPAGRILTETGKPQHIVLFPDSRKKEKKLPAEVTQQICEDALANGNTIQVAYFGKQYGDFRELVSLINKADAIVSSDSLPVHLAQFFNKPHKVFYNKKINHEWLTPFAEQEKQYDTF